MVRDIYANFNIARDGQFTVPVAAPVTLRSFDGGVEAHPVFNLFDIPASLRGVIPHRFTTSPTRRRRLYNYDTIELAFNKRFGGGLFIDSSFDYLRRDELRANAASTSAFRTDRSASATSRTSTPTVFEPPAELDVAGAGCRAAICFPHRIGIGANVQVQSGSPWARLISVALPNAGTQTFST